MLDELYEYAQMVPSSQIPRTTPAPPTLPTLPSLQQLFPWLPTLATPVPPPTLPPPTIAPSTTIEAGIAENLIGGNQPQSDTMQDFLDANELMRKFLR